MTRPERIGDPIGFVLVRLLFPSRTDEGRLLSAYHEKDAAAEPVS